MIQLLWINTAVLFQERQSLRVLYHVLLFDCGFCNLSQIHAYMKLDSHNLGRR